VGAGKPAGGDLYAAGKRGQKKWTVGIYDPRTKQAYAELEVQDEGVATSGNYERFVIIDGVCYHHILDPRTGMPVRGLASVTVVAKNAALADGYATAVFVAGKTRALELAAAQHFDVHLLDEDFRASASKGMSRRLGGKFCIPQPIK